MKTIAQLAQTALDVQNAVNLSDMLHAWAEAQQVLRDGLGTSVDYRRHPVNILFLSKITSLMVVATDCIGGVYKGGAIEGYEEDLFRGAYEKCIELAREVGHEDRQG